MPAKFLYNLTKNLTVHLHNNLCAVLPYVTALIFNDEKYGLKIGDTLSITTNGRTKEFTLAGSVKDAAFGSPMFGMTRMLVSENDFDFFRSDDLQMIYSVSVSSDDSGFVEKLNASEIQTLFYVDYSELKVTFIMDMLTAAIILIVSICLILISMVILRFTINFTMSEGFREIGVMKAIGIQNRKIRGIYITKYFAMSMLGAAIGFMLSIPFGKLLLKDVSKNIIMESSGGMLINLLCALLTAVIVVLFCYFCTRKIKKYSPIDAIRNGENGERYSRKGVIHLSGTRLAPVPFMAVNDIFSRLRRFAAMILIFALGLLLIIIPINTINTLQSDNMITWFNMAKCDQVISVETIFNTSDNKKMLTDNLDKVRECLAENGVQAEVFQEAMFKMRITYGDKKYSSLAFQGIGDVTTDDYVCESGSMPTNVNEVAITSMVADKIGAKIGDDVEIKNGDTTKTYTVCGVFQSMNNMGEGIRFHQDENLDYSYATGCFGIQIRYTDSPDSKTLAERKDLLKENFSNSKVFTAGEYVSNMIGDVASQLDSIKQLIIAVVLCINILVTVLMVKSFLTKEKGEIAMLKAIGFRSSSLVAWQTFRLGIVFMVALILAAVLSTPLTSLTVEPIFKMMGAQSISFEINPIEVYVIYPFTVLAVTTLAGFLSALHIGKISPNEISNIE